MATTFLTLIGPRACGKSTVAKELRGCLGAPWQVFDIDSLHDQQVRPHRGSALMVHADAYYSKCREIVYGCLEATHAIVALGGGTLMNAQYPSGDSDLVIELKKLGPLVLLLPSVLSMRNRRILYARERKRSYEVPPSVLRNLKRSCYNQYNNRIDFMEDNADFIAYGTNPVKTAEKIAKRYSLAKDLI